MEVEAHQPTPADLFRATLRSKSVPELQHLKNLMVNDNSKMDIIVEVLQEKAQQGRAGMRNSNSSGQNKRKTRGKSGEGPPSKKQKKKRQKPTTIRTTDHRSLNPVEIDHEIQETEPAQEVEHVPSDQTQNQKKWKEYFDTGLKEGKNFYDILVEASNCLLLVRSTKSHMAIWANSFSKFIPI